MGGPWFAVLRSDGDWHSLGPLWLSDGTRDLKARVDVRLRLAPPPAGAPGALPTPAAADSARPPSLEDVR